METSSGNIIWKHHLEKPSGNIIWKHHLETSFGNHTTQPNENNNENIQKIDNNQRKSTKINEGRVSHGCLFCLLFTLDACLFCLKTNTVVCPTALLFKTCSCGSHDMEKHTKHCDGYVCRNKMLAQMHKKCFTDSHFSL